MLFQVFSTSKVSVSQILAFTSSKTLLAQFSSTAFTPSKLNSNFLIFASFHHKERLKEFCFSLVQILKLNSATLFTPVFFKYL
ncbi:MAG: hypothetical protein LBD88_05150 [Candidatus Peribacteria bacterium]|nr:hypothetical protein [Candidatus Peribacteria bacterium]